MYSTMLRKAADQNFYRGIEDSARNSSRCQKLQCKAMQHVAIALVMNRAPQLMLIEKIIHILRFMLWELEGFVGKWSNKVLVLLHFK